MEVKEMSKVVFEAEKAFTQVSHDSLFHVGIVHTLYKPTNDGKGRVWVGSHEEWEALQKLPDPEMVNSLYTFSEGENHNQLTVERDDVIEAMRAYIKGLDNSIVELDAEGNFPAEPEGTPFISRVSHEVLTPAILESATPDGKPFRFNMGVERNKYITADKEEIAIIRRYIRSHANCGIADPTYKDPFSEA
jgi:hypothetical protein